MMKKLILLAFFLFAQGLVAQDAWGSFTFVYDIEGAAKADLFKAGLLWVADTYNSADAVITFKDADLGRINGTGRGEAKDPWQFNLPSEFRYNMQIDFKDGKARIIFSSVETYQNKWTFGMDTHNKKVQKIIGDYFAELAEKFHQAIVAPPGGW